MDTHPEQDKINKALGFALGHFAAVEFELSIIFRQALQPKFPDGAVAAYYAVRSFEVRLAMTNAAIRSLAESKVIDDDLNAEWNAIYNHCDRKATKRNALAHSCCTKDINVDGSVSWYLECFPQMYCAARSNGDHYLTVRQIHERAASFSRLGLRLSKFEQSLAEHLGIPSISRLQDDGLPPAPDK